MNGAELKVFVDDSLVWAGSPDRDVLGVDGLVGIGSDNERLQIELRAGQPSKAQARHMPGCRTGAGKSE